MWKQGAVKVFFRKSTSCMHIPAMLVIGRVNATLWCQSQNQGAVLILHVNIEAAEAWQEHHLASSTAQCMSLWGLRGKGVGFPNDLLYGLSV